MVTFENITPVTSSIIMVVGVGGGGGNAVNHMYRQGIADVSFMVCNTDRQALDRSPIPTKIRLGEKITEGLGAGNTPERGRQAAMESIEEIKEAFKVNQTKMVFVTAGMGGGTGTGAAPVIAQVAKEMGILTVAIVTIPFKVEGPKRISQAIAGIEEISQCVDSLLVVNNANIREIYGDLPLPEAFSKADDILATAAKGIAEIITNEFIINVDFADVRTVMKDSGIALMASAKGKSTEHAMEIAKQAINSPLLYHNRISGAKNILLNIAWGEKAITIDDTYAIQQFVQEQASGHDAADIIWGAGYDSTLGEDIRITIVATGFDVHSIPAMREYYEVVGKNPAGGFAQQPAARQVINFDDESATLSPVKKEVEQDPDDFSIVDKQQPRAEPVQRYQQRHVTATPVVETIEQTEEKTEQPVSVNLPQEPKTIFNMSEEEREDVPAWMRRGIQLDNTVNTSRVRESLHSDTPAKPAVETIDLFSE